MLALGVPDRACAPGCSVAGAGTANVRRRAAPLGVAPGTPGVLRPLGQSADLTGSTRHPRGQGDRRPPSPLGDIQPDHWLAEYTSDLIDLLNVLGRLVLLEPQQAALLDEILAGRLLDRATLVAAGALGASQAGNGT